MAASSDHILQVESRPKAKQQSGLKLYYILLSAPDFE
jgi:hypothetical protein